MEAVDVRGRFVWHQLMTRDVPGAKKFYSRLVGWKPQAWPLDPTYTVCQAEFGPAAGIMEIPADFPAEMPSHWLQYVGTTDVNATADAAVRAGGSVVAAPDDLKGAGRYAVLKDPQGAVFAVISPENARPEIQGVPALGSFSWHELATTDSEAAFAFYRGLFGWDALERMDMGALGTYLIFGANGVQRGGIYNKPADMPAPPNWLPYVHVQGADAAHALAQSLGAKPMMEPMEVPGGSRVAGVFDPAGAPFAVHSMPAAVPAAQARPLKATAKAKPRAGTKPKAKSPAKAKVSATAPKRKAKATAPKRKAKAAAPKRKAVRTRAPVKRKAAAQARKPAARKQAAVRKKSKTTVRRKK